MNDGTDNNGRDESDLWAEELLENAGAKLSRVLNGYQRHAVSLAFEVFAYLLASLRLETVEVVDVLRYMRKFVRGVLNAKGES